MVKETIKQDLIRLFNEGKNEVETFEEISNTHSSNLISLKIVNNWFAKFRSGKHVIDDKKKIGRKPKFSDEFLINLVNQNPDMNMKELAKLAGTTSVTISNKLKQIEISEGEVIYIKKGTQDGKTKFTDEFLINLVNENPNMSTTGLAKLADTTSKTISKRLKQINSGEQRVNYIVKDFKNTGKSFTNEHLINFINENPESNSFELAKFFNISQQAIYARLRQVNSTRTSEDKIVLKNNASKSQRKSHNTITEDSLIKLIDENPELNVYELAKLGDVSSSKIYQMLKIINANGQRANYIKKGKRNGIKKITDEFLINLVNENPELSLKKLAKLSNTSMATIKNRLNQINIDGKCVNYVKKDFKHVEKKFTDEFLINLVSENPKCNTSKLAKLAGTSQSTISRRLREISSNNEQIENYINSKLDARKKLTDEFITNLVNENPDLNMTGLAKLANCSPSTMSRRLRIINSDVKE